MTIFGRAKGGNVGAFSSPVEICGKLNQRFPEEKTELAPGTVTALARSFQWCKPHFHSCFRSQVISGFNRANSTWTECSSTGVWD